VSNPLLRSWRRRQAPPGVADDDAEAAPLLPWLGAGEARLGDFTRSPGGRDSPRAAVPLPVKRGDDFGHAPGDDFALAPDDEIVLAGRASARQELDATPVDAASRLQLGTDDREVDTDKTHGRASDERACGKPARST
jgi:hypothetical protein